MGKTNKSSIDGDFVGRDKNVQGDEVGGDKIGGNKITVGNITGDGPVNIAGGDIHVSQNASTPLKPKRTTSGASKFPITQKDKRMSASAKKLFGFLIGLAAIVGCIAAVLVVPEVRLFLGLDGGDFSYQVRVQREGTGEIIKDAKVIIEVTGNAPLIGYTDSNGYARIFVGAKYSGQPGRLRVEAMGYEPYWEQLDITAGSLPAMILLQANAITLISTPILALTSSVVLTEKLTLTPLPGRITDEKGVEMVLVPAGEFQMGSEDGDSDERPVHAVYLDAFYIDVYEVTNARYEACVQEGYCSPPGDSSSYTRDNYYGNADYDGYPVIHVDWAQARAFCEWRRADLPSEAQWEKAARGGLEGKMYPWGDEAPVCWKGAINGAKYTDDAGCNNTDTEPVGSYAPNGYELYDMAGNVSEWVWDWYSELFYQGLPYANPVGPDVGQRRALRGGAWNDGVKSVRAAIRYGNIPNGRYVDVGFRCARSS